LSYDRLLKNIMDILTDCSAKTTSYTLRKLCCFVFTQLFFAVLAVIPAKAQEYSKAVHSASATHNENPATNGYKINWKANPFDQKIFIENLGQFDNLLKSDDKILYGATIGNIHAYFTANGLTYRYEESPKPTLKKNKSEESEKEREEAEREVRKNPKIHYLGLTWEGANPASTVEAQEKRRDYYVYATGPASSIQVSLFKKIIYRNLYPGIDVEYIFPEGKEGLKYSVIVHPGADVSKVKLRYTGTKGIRKNNKGDLITTGSMGDFTDHAPVSYYEEKTSSDINVKYNLQGTEVSFLIQEPYNTSKTFVIDPWITSPIFAGTSKAGPYDLDYDNNGNIYARNSTAIVKLNSAGNILWTFIGTNPIAWGSGLAVDKATGNSYSVRSFSSHIQKFSSTGALLATNSSLPSNTEAWRVVWNPCDNKLIIGLGLNAYPSFSAPSMASADANLTTVTVANPLGTNYTNYIDVAGLAMDPSGTDCYMIPTRGTNQLIKLPAPALSPTTYSTPTGYTFAELVNGYETGNNGLNIIAASRNWVYVWDGYSLKQFNKTIGALNASNVINPGPPTNPVNPRWAGVNADDCDNVYVGNKTAVSVYNSSLGFIKSIALPNTDTVTDVKVGPMDKVIYACGSSFITSIDITGPAKDSIAKVTTQAACSCNGTATATFVLCGSPVTAGITYLWSNGQTTQTATGLCAGTHNITVFYNCEPLNDTVTITSPSGLSATATQTNLKCYGGNTGSSTVSPGGGTPPYAYSWSSGGGTNATATNLNAGIYTVTITDANGCKITSIVNITQPNPLIANVATVNNSCTTTGSATVSTSNSGPFTYTWSSGSSSRTANPLAAGNYTVTVNAANGCSETSTISITGTNPVSATYTQSQTTVCLNTAVNFTNTGSTGTYSWTIAPVNVTGTGANFSYTFLTAGNYSVTHTVTSGGCTGTVTSDVNVINCAAPTATATGGSACPGSCVTVTSSGSGGTAPYSYTWSNGPTTQTASACPLSTTTYTVTIKDAVGATATTTATVTINPAISIAATPILNCGTNSGSVTATTTGGSTNYTYSWSNGVTTVTSALTSQVSSLTSNTYSVTVTDSKGCSASSSTIIDPPLSAQYIKGTSTCTGCGCKEWIMVTPFNGRPPYTYAWPDGYDKRYMNKLCPSTYIISVTDKNGCNINVTVNTP
jgi:VCBS repeat-containing protein